jgi:hypothetical protein
VQADKITEFHGRAVSQKSRHMILTYCLVKDSYLRYRSSRSPWQAKRQTFCLLTKAVLKSSTTLVPVYQLRFVTMHNSPNFSLTNFLSFGDSSKGSRCSRVNTAIDKPCITSCECWSPWDSPSVPRAISLSDRVSDKAFWNFRFHHLESPFYSPT